MKNKIEECFEFRTIRPDETEQAARIESICFPPNEACSAEEIKARIEAAADYFLAAIDLKNGKVAGFLNGVATRESRFRDEFLSDATLHDPAGSVVMLTGLDVLPEYRGRGLARELMSRYIEMSRRRGITLLVLTCLSVMMEMYEKFGFSDRGISDSAWGGEQWHEMELAL